MLPLSFIVIPIALFYVYPEFATREQGADSYQQMPYSRASSGVDQRS